MEKTNIHLQSLIKDLKHLAIKEKVPLWNRIAEELGKSTRSRREASVGKIDKHAREGEIAIVPGKVLSDGEMTKKIFVAAFNFSERARMKINRHGKAMSIRELMKQGAKGKRVRIIA